MPMDATTAMARHRAARAVAGALWLVAIVAALFSTGYWVAVGAPALPTSFATGPANVIGLGSISITLATVGSLLGARLPRNPVGWLLLGCGLAVASMTPVNLLVERTAGAGQVPPSTTVFVAWLGSTLANPLALALMVLSFLLFPNGRFVPGRWWISGALTIVGAGLLVVGSALDPTGLFWYPGLPNPAALPGSYVPALIAVRLAGAAVILLALAGAAWSTSIRYREADTRVRLQLRWIVFGVALMIATIVPFVVARYVLDAGDAVNEVLMALVAIAACTYPVTIAIAINRQHLFEIDAIISRTLVYVPLMGLLAGLYAASIVFFQRLFLLLTGNSSDVAIILSSLMLAGVFAPTRSALEAQVARRFRPLAAPLELPASGATPARPGTDANDPRLDELAERVSALERRLAQGEGTGRQPT